MKKSSKIVGIILSPFPAIVLITLLISNGFAENTVIELYDEVTVSGDKVRIGDIAAVEGPDEGTNREIAGFYLQDVIRDVNQK